MNITNYLKNVKINKIVGFTLLISFLFICKGVGVNSMLHGGMNHDMMPCCDYQDGSMMLSESMDKFIVILPGVITIAFIVIVLGVLLTCRITAVVYNPIYWYYFWVRKRSGSTKLFNFYNKILRLGILQPKVF